MTPVAAPPVDLSLLRQCSLFDGLDDVECRALAAVVTRHRCEPGELVLRQGETDQELWVVAAGECEVVRQHVGAEASGAAVVLATLGPGETLGEMSFFQAAPHSASVRATTPLELLRLSREDFDARVNHGCRAAFKLAVNMVGTLARRMREMDRWVDELLREESPAPRQAEWSGFRDKLFKEWTQ